MVPKYPVEEKRKIKSAYFLQTSQEKCHLLVSVPFERDSSFFKLARVDLIACVLFPVLVKSSFVSLMIFPHSQLG